MQRISAQTKREEAGGEGNNGRSPVNKVTLTPSLCLWTSSGSWVGGQSEGISNYLLCDADRIALTFPFFTCFTVAPAFNPPPFCDQ